MSHNQRFIAFSLAILSLAAGLYLFIPRFYNYLAMKQVAQAIGTMPYQFGGIIADYQPACVATPPDGICKNCLQCNTAVGPYICAGYTEIDFTLAPGSMPPAFVCPSRAFFYSGGGFVPKTKSYILGGGFSSAAPLVIGVSP